MGCNGCKQRPEMVEEILLQAFEQSLGIHLINLLTIDRVLHRYSTGSGMSISQLEKAFSELGLDLEGFDMFYRGFYKKHQFSLNQLNCLGILLSNEPVNKKLKILFQNYDCDTSGELSREELVIMVNDLTEVACILIPNGARNANPGNKELTEYLTEISSVRKSLNRQIVISIIEDRETITEREFILSYQCDEITKILLSTKTLRQYSYSIKKNILGSVQTIMKSINEDNTEVFNIINYRSRKVKKNKTKKMNIQ